MVKDLYRSFAELTQNEREEVDYRRFIQEKNSPVTVIALHGGSIEPGTAELARAIAGDDFSLYVFESLKPIGDNKMHITSYRFDDPLCLRVVARAQTVVAIHGCQGHAGRVFVGGLDEKLKSEAISALQLAGYTACEDLSHHAGKYHRNICNRGITGKGLQLEIDTTLRRKMFHDDAGSDLGSPTHDFTLFTATLREILLNHMDNADILLGGDAPQS